MKLHEKILVVDDENSFLTFTSRILQQQGYECFKAIDSSEALEQLKSNTIDLCLLDVKMPGKTGDVLLKEIKRIYPEVAVIMATGVSTLEMAHKCSALGADEYLVKPFEPERLLISVQNVLDRRRLLQENIFYRTKLENKLSEQAEKLRASQSLLVQQEKLAAIGQLAAGIAHEINNPLGFVSSNLNTLQKYIGKIADYKNAIDELSSNPLTELHQELLDLKRKNKLDSLLEDLPDLITESIEGTEKIKIIVQSLKTFSRTDNDKKVVLDVNECLESAITVVWNEIKYNSKLERNFSELPPIMGYPQQLAQVFMNLLVNASHAIESKGMIKAKTWAEDDQLIVTISDNGCGIADKDLCKIFDPFFTTKPPGKGTGLGMSIASDIVRKHDGRIEVESVVGKGTTFTVKLSRTTDSA